METPLKGVNRRQFPEQLCGHGCRTRLGRQPRAATAGSQVSRQPASLVEVMSGLAPQGLTLKPGPGFAMERNGEMLDWELDSLEEQTADLWQFRYRSAEGLEASGQLRLDRTFRVGEYRVKLTNTSERRSRPLTRLFSLFLRLGGVTDSRIMSCSGAGSASYFPHARGISLGCLSSPLGSNRFTIARVEFASHRNLTGCPTGSCEVAVPVKQRGFGERWTGSSSQDLPLFMVSQGPDSEQPGIFFGMEWSTFWQARVAFDGSPERPAH